MILIITNDNDKAVEEIIDWLIHFEADYFKGSLDHVFLNNEITIKERGVKLDLFFNEKRVNCMFTRQLMDLNVLFEKIVSKTSISHFLDNEVKTILTSFSDKFSCKAFPYLNKINNNKVNDLMLAKSVGLMTPSFLITNQKHKLIEFKKRENNIVCKALSNGARLAQNNNNYFTYVGLITDNIIDELEDKFYLSFFQSFIDKSYELRVFFIANSMFAMAIMSQESEQTSIDFRKYNVEKWNRNIPYRLPKELKTKLIALMKSLDLTTGSIDIVKSKEGKYYFLEVNPIGQFGMTSSPCNYFLDMKIAEKLIEYDKIEY
jgi:ATP-GRASP peptide maturase of grasp-with-spasm system